jgi:hypothetical protein
MSNDGGSFGRWDWVTAAFFFTVSLALHVPFRSQLTYHWDGAQFALSIGAFDMRIGQPQPPGYFLYVMLGKFVNLFVGEPHTSLVWLSVVAGAALPAVGFLLAKAMFGRAVGIATAVILATSPLCWFHSEVALTSIVDAVLVTSTVLACWTAIRHGGRWKDVFWLSVLFAAVAGVRQQSGAILLPVWCYALLRFRRPRWPRVLAVVLITGLFCALWFVPMVSKTGGVAEYLHLLQAKGRFDAPKTMWGGGGMNALLTNVSMIARACWVGLLLAAVILVGEFFYWVFGERAEVKQQLYKERVEQIRVLAAWIVPMILFWLIMYVTMPGYVLCFFPGLAIMTGIAMERFAGRLARFFDARKVTRGRRWKIVPAILTVGSVAGINVIVFAWQPKYLNSVLGGLPLTRVEIKRHDQQLSACFRVIRQKFDPENIIIYHSDQFFYWGFRQFQYHLPEYRNVLLSSDSSLSGDLRRKPRMAQHRRTTFIDSTNDLPGRIALLIVPPQESVQAFNRYFDVSTAELMVESGVKLYLVKRSNR